MHHFTYFCLKSTHISPSIKLCISKITTHFCSNHLHVYMTLAKPNNSVQLLLSQSPSHSLNFTLNSLLLSQSRYHLTLTLPHALNLPLSLTLALILSLPLALDLPLSLDLALYSPSCSHSLLSLSVCIFSLESQGMSPYLNICLSIGYLWCNFWIFFFLFLFLMNIFMCYWSNQSL